MIYHKLVRDKIPQIIAQKGGKSETRILAEDEYRICLEAKLDEEVGEYHRDKTPEELADILEVVYALAEANGCSKQQLLQIYEKKHHDRGGVADRIFLISSEEG